MSDITRLSLRSDWFGDPLSPPLDCTQEWHNDGIELSFSRSAPSCPHPASQLSRFQEGLWEFDVAEAFFQETESGRYLEVNLAPNGGWWASWHSGVRVREERQPDFSQIKTKGECKPDSWKASIFLPASLFHEPLPSLRYNLTAILNSPQQTFHTLASLPGKNPDFHQPEHFLSQGARVPS